MKYGVRTYSSHEKINSFFLLNNPKVLPGFIPEPIIINIATFKVLFNDKTDDDHDQHRPLLSSNRDVGGGGESNRGICYHASKLIAVM